MTNKISEKLFTIARWIDMSIAEHARVPESKCKWYCKPGAKIADKLRLIGNKLWKDLS